MSVSPTQSKYAVRAGMKCICLKARIACHMMNEPIPMDSSVIQETVIISRWTRFSSFLRDYWQSPFNGAFSKRRTGVPPMWVHLDLWSDPDMFHVTSVYRSVTTTYPFQPVLKSSFWYRFGSSPFFLTSAILTGILLLLIQPPWSFMTYNMIWMVMLGQAIFCW